MTTKRGPGTIRQYQEELKALQAELTDVTIKKATVKEVKKIICRWFTLSVRIAMDKQKVSLDDIKQKAINFNDKKGYEDAKKQIAIEFNDENGYEDAIKNVFYGRGGTSIKPAVVIAYAVDKPLGELLPPIIPLNEDDGQRVLSACKSLWKKHPEYSTNLFIACRIKEEIGYLGWTIDDLASKSGLGRATVSAIQPETGVAIRLTTLWLIAKALCVPVDYLLPSLSQLSKLLNNP